MEQPPVLHGEPARLAALNGYDILDTLPEPEFDDIAKIASQLCQTPISLISLIDTDRQWFKANNGLKVNETTRNIAFCAHTINSTENMMVVNDSRKDSRFADNPLVTNYPKVIFYAGVKLVDDDGQSLGTLCVIDHQPRVLDQRQLDALQALSHQVVKLFELRKKNKQLNLFQTEINNRNEELEKFAYVVSHDIKSPLTNIHNLAEILKQDHGSALNPQGHQLVDYIVKSSIQVRDLVDGIIAFYTGDATSKIRKTSVDFTTFLQEIISLLDPVKEFQITYPTNGPIIRVNEIALRQIFLNLISNAIKYNTKDQVEIDLSYTEDTKCFYFSVKDNGDGIEERHRLKVFQPMTTLGKMDRFKKKGSGIGLSTVKKLIENMEGTISISSEVGVGSTFDFSIKK